MPSLDRNGKWQPTPKFYKNEALNRRKYLDQEFERWKNGYGNITGLHYFHITQGQLIDAELGKICPIWRDGDAYVFDSYEEAKSMGWDLLVAKRREFGLSSIFGGCVPTYNSIMSETAVSLLTSADERRINGIKLQKLFPYLHSLKEWLPQDSEGKPNYYNNPSFVRLVDRRTPDKVGPEIHFPETSSTPKAATNLEGFRAQYIFLDEYFLHPRAEVVKMSSKACLMKGMDKIGIMVMGGSCNNIIKDSAGRLRLLIEQSEALRMKVIFIPAWMCMQGFMDKSGFSLKDKAMEAIYKERQRLLDGRAWDDLGNYIRSYPLSLKEMYSAADKMYLGEEVAAQIEDSRVRLHNEESQLTRCSLLQWEDKIVMNKDLHGNVFILKKPVQGHKYIIGMDPIDFISVNEDGSEFCAAVKDITTNEYVAYYKTRDNDSEKVLNEWYKLAMFYKSDAFPNGAPSMAESNRLGAVKIYCKMRNLMPLLARDPGKRGNDPDDKGYYKAVNNMNELDALLIEFIRKYGLPFMQAVNDFEKNPKSDLLDAMRACEYFHSYFNQAVPEQVPQQRKVIKRDSMGRTYEDWE